MRKSGILKKWPWKMTQGQGKYIFREKEDYTKKMELLCHL